MGNNVMLKDEMMANATGGYGNDDIARYDAYGEVIRYLDDQQYLVILDDGGEVTAIFNERRELSQGTKVGLRSLAGGWEMETI